MKKCLKNKFRNFAYDLFSFFIYIFLWVEDEDQIFVYLFIIVSPPQSGPEDHVPLRSGSTFAGDSRR